VPIRHPGQQNLNSSEAPSIVEVRPRNEEANQRQQDVLVKTCRLRSTSFNPPWRLSQRQQIGLSGDPQNTWRHVECSKRWHKPRGYSQTGSSEPDFTDFTISPKNNGKTKGFIAFYSFSTSPGSGPDEEEKLEDLGQWSGQITDIQSSSWYPRTNHFWWLTLQLPQPLHPSGAKSQPLTCSAFSMLCPP
jgi:hypothetical protein